MQDNGGPTFTRALLSGSPALDKGIASGMTLDQRGFVRPSDDPAIANRNGGDGSDIGAFEVQVSSAHADSLAYPDCGTNGYSYSYTYCYACVRAAW